jgi:hypothetical protein
MGIWNRHRSSDGSMQILTLRHHTEQLKVMIRKKFIVYLTISRLISRHLARLAAAAAHGGAELMGIGSGPWRPRLGSGALNPLSWSWS